MGQAFSRGSTEQRPQSDSRRRRSALLRLPSSVNLVPSAVEADASPPAATAPSSLLRRSSRLIRSANLSVTSSLPNVFSRSRPHRNTSTSSLLNHESASASASASVIPPTRPRSPRYANDSTLTVPSLNPRYEPLRRRHSFRADPGSSSDNQVSARRASFRDLGSRLRQSLPQTTLRRRSSSMQRGDEHTAMLSRLLSAAALHTAASIIGDDPTRQLSFRGNDNGAFDNFLESLQNGSLHTALRQSVQGDDSRTDGDGRRSNQLNFFRMFRLGTVEGPASRSSESLSGGTMTSEHGPSGSASRGENNTDGRLVPIIIVGIRSINSGNPDDTGFPPFIDALSNLPATTTPADAPFDGVLPQARNNTSFSHRRRASMGGPANLQSAYDNQRSQPPADRARPFSATSESLTGARPPPSTPASAGLSAYPSGATTPTQAPNASLGNTPTLSSRHSSFSRNPASRMDSQSTLGQNPEESEALRRTARRRRRSESDFGRYGSGSSRRNGVVGLDSTDDLQEEAQRSWIIYVLGGSYPENHPILSTPSLFSDSPTYEDMLLLSTLIGPAKPPVASEAEIARAPGLYRVSRVTNSDDEQQRLIANEIDGEGFLVITATDRCLVCLSEFADDEVVRQLVKCQHLFHRDCIDQWLTTGRNSCPLCREEGVEKSSESSTPTEPPPDELTPTFP